MEWETEGYTYLAKLIEYAIKIYQDLTFGNLGNIVHGLAGIVANPSILIGETGKHRRDNPGQITRQLLIKMSVRVEQRCTTRNR